MTKKFCLKKFYLKKFCFWLDLKIGTFLFGIILIPISIIGIWFCVSAISNSHEIANKECDHLDRAKVYVIHSHSRKGGSRTTYVSEFDKCVSPKTISDVGYVLLIILLGSNILFYIVMPCYIPHIEKVDTPRLNKNSQVIGGCCMFLLGQSIFIIIFPMNIMDVMARLIALLIAIPHGYYCFCLYSLCKEFLNERQRNEETPWETPRLVVMDTTNQPVIDTIDKEVQSNVSMYI